MFWNIKNKNKEELWKSENKYRALVESATDAIISSDAAGNIVDWNKSAEKIFGYKSEEAIGKPLFFIMPERFREAHLKGMERVNLGGERRVIGKTIEVSGLRKNGTEVPIELSLAAWEEKGKRFYTAIIRDITERKQKTEDFEKFKLAVDNSTEHIIISDSEGIVLYLNEAAEKITGFSREEAVGKKAGVLWGKQMNLEFYKAMWQKIKYEKKPFIGEIINKRKSGQKYAAAISISPILDEVKNVKFFVGIERDITREKEIDKAKTEFVSLASHQLRTPLSIISWYAETLLSGDAGKLGKRQLEYLREIYDSNKRMINLVSSLLNISRIELGTFAIEPKITDIPEVVEDILSELNLQIKKKNLDVEKIYESLSPVKVDRNVVRIILQNLLSNAVKYNKTGGKIKVEIKKGGGSIFIRVSDTGHGIPLASSSRIFEKLYRADNAKEIDPDGTGLGLYIVKEVLKRIGGETRFESEEGKGTAFYITFPENI